MRKTILITSLLASALLLAACGAGSSEQASLDGSAWILAAINGNDVVIDGGQELTLSFEDGRLSGYSGCNQFGGEYSANRQTGTLEISPLETTLMACLDDDVMAREGEYQSALQAAESYRLDGDVLTIETADGVLRFSRSAQ